MNIVEPDSTGLTDRLPTQSGVRDPTPNGQDMYQTEVKDTQGITNIQTSAGEVEFMVSPADPTVHVTHKL